MVKDENENENDNESESESESEREKVNDDDEDEDEDNDDADDDEEVEYNKLVPELLLSDDENEDEDEDLDENYLQKLDLDVNKKIIEDYHPEILSHNVEEVETACTLIRNDKGTIVDPLHRTLPFVTRYEKARVIGERAKQINSGAQPFITVETTLIDGYLIALEEYEQKKIPFIVRRPLPNGNSEYWRLSDLDII